MKATNRKVQGRAEACDSYSFLCDHAHANAACLVRYHRYEENGVVMRFIDPDLGPHQESFLPFVNCCLIDLLKFGLDLLALANENAVRPKVLHVLKEMVRLAPPSLTGSVSGDETLVRNAAPELPVWDLGAVGQFRRRDIYNDVR